jgi:hypothetical protein
LPKHGLKLKLAHSLSQHLFEWADYTGASIMDRYPQPPWYTTAFTDPGVGWWWPHPYEKKMFFIAFQLQATVTVFNKIGSSG